MAEELSIRMDSSEDIVVTVTQEAESLNPLIFSAATSYKELRRSVVKVTGVEDVHILYIDDEGDAVALSSKEEFQEAWKQAMATKQLHIMAQPPLKATPTPSNPYVQLASCIGEERKHSKHSKKERRRKTEEVATALLGKTPSVGDTEPLWFNRAMEKYTDKVIQAICNETTPPMPRPPVMHEGIICDGCDQRLIGTRYKCGNCCDYDLCEKCEQRCDSIHNKDHVFIKISRPAPFAGVNRKGKRKPLLKRSVYSVPLVVDTPLLTTPPAIKGVEPLKEPEMIRKSKDKLREELRPGCHSNRREPVGLEPSEEMIKKTKKQVKRELHETRRKKRMEKEVKTEDHTPSSITSEDHTPSSITSEDHVPSSITADKREDHAPSTVTMEKSENHAPSTVIADTASPKGHGKCLSGTFVEDTSHPDDSVVYYGKPFAKGWVIENTGSKGWRKVKLVYQNGYQPIEQEITVPELAPGAQVELIVNYPPISPSDGVEIRSSWRLIHDGHTPFGDTLWLCVIAQPDPNEELSNTFELISYPSLPAGDHTSYGFNPDPLSESSGTASIAIVDTPTPLMSLNSNDSLFQTNEEEEEVVKEATPPTTPPVISDDEEFLVVIPDCFKLDVPLSGFDPSVEELSSSAHSLVSCDDNEVTSSVTVEPPPTQAPPTQTPPTNESPDTIRKRFVPRDTLDAAWTSRSMNPLRYAVGVVNTVADLVETHVHFVKPQSEAPPTVNEVPSTVNDIPPEAPPTDEAPEENINVPPLPTPPMVTPSAPPLSIPHTVTPSAPPLPTPPTVTPSAPPLPTPANISDITCQEQDISRYLNQKWAGPKPPETPMDQLVSMGFANRDLNSRLLKKHSNDLQLVLQELLETSGDGYLC